MEQLDFVDSKFRLAILAAKRAKQLVGGAKRRIETGSDNPLSIALEEITEGHINYQVIEEFEREAAEREAMASLSDDSENSFLFNTKDDSSSLNFNEDEEEENEEDDEDENEEESEADNEEDSEEDSEEEESEDDEEYVEAEADAEVDVGDEGLDEDDSYEDDNDDFEVGDDKDDD